MYAIITLREVKDTCAAKYCCHMLQLHEQIKVLGLNEMYVWFLLPTYPNCFNPTLNIKMVFGEKIPKMGTFSRFCHYFLC